MKEFFKRYPKYKWLLAALDIALILYSIFFTLSIRFARPMSANTLGLNLWASESQTYFSFAVLALFYLQFAGLYKIQNVIKPLNHFFLIAKSTFTLVIGLIVTQFVLQDFNMTSRLFYLILYVIMLGLFSILRIPFVKFLGGQSLLRDRIVILGAGIKGQAFMEVIAKRIKIKKTIGFLDDNIPAGQMVKGLPVFGKLEDADCIAKANDVDIFVLAIDKISRERFFEIFKYFQEHNLGLSVSSDYLKVLYENMTVDVYDEFGLVRFPSVTDNRLYHITKRAFDLFFSSLGILVFSPFFFVLALLVKLSSPGPIIYKQIRIGKGGKPFYFYKFRSMYVKSDQDGQRDQKIASFIRGEKVHEQGKQTKVVNKNAITKIGQVLRKYSLDELPQLFNVIKGDMSIVGARPCLVHEWKLYEDWQKLRLEDIPGCTGLWQVKGRSKVDFEESVLMDIYYNKNYTPWLDVQIILKTIPVMLFGRGGA